MDIHNFTRVAIPFVEKRVRKINGEMEDFKIFCKDVIKNLKVSQKFIAPDGGRTLETKFKSLPEFIKLPFPSVAIEYTFANAELGLAERYLGKENTVESRKRIALAVQRSEHSIDVYSIFGVISELHPTVTEWDICAYYVTVHDKESEYVLRQGVKPIPKSDTSKPPEVIEDFFVEYKCGSQTIRDMYPDWIRRAFIDMQDEALSVLNLIEVLACSNVETELIKPKKRFPSVMRSGVLPFDDYHVLVIGNKRNETDSVDNTNIGTHRSPREHLRRGHIRRYVNKTIFVQPCVVNAGKGGVITKDYVLQ